MEGLHSKMKANGTNIDNEPSHRLPTRPKGMLFEDHNSLLVSSSQQRKGSGPKALKFKPSEPSVTHATSPKRNGRAATRSPSKYGSNSRSGSQSVVKAMASSSNLADSRDVSDESDDEFDLLSSQPGGRDDPATYQQPVSSSQDFSKTVGQKVHTDKKGVTHAFDPRYPPNTIYKSLKFTKNKTPSNSEGGSSAHSQPSSSIPTSEPPLSKENAGSSKIRSTKEEDDNDTVYVKRTAPLEIKGAIPKRNPSSFTATLTTQPSSSLSRLSQSSTLPDLATTKVAGTRPRPKPVGKAKLQVEEPKTRPDLQSEKEASSSQPRPEGTLKDLFVQLDVDADTATPRERSGSKSPRRGRNSSPKQTRTRKAAPPPFDWSRPGTPRGSSPPAPRRKAQAAEFPMDLPPAPSEEEDSSSKKTRSTKRQPTGSSTTSRKPAPFPMAMPPDAKGKGKDTSQLTSKTRVKSSKQRNRISESPPDSDNGGGETIVVRRKPPTDKGKAKETRSKPQLQEFPMSTQMLASIESSPINGGKRSSEGGSDDDRRSKKSRKLLDVSMASPTRDFDDEGDSMMMLAPNVDPKTLCPFCDTPLPSNPSPLLLRILNSIRKKASRDPRPSNPLGLKAPITVFVAACQRHRFESQILPEAEAKGWPKSIEWTEVAGRVARMKNSLQALIEDPGDGSSEAPGDSEGDEDEDVEWEVPFNDKGKGRENKEPRKKGAKARSIFWQEIMEVVKAKGLRAVTGVRGQFSSFEKAQPGYYGEQGSVIITQTLYNMFPLSSIDPTLVAPLTANEFVQRVLVPEVALRLIMEDNDLKGQSGKQDALVILRESSAFGVAMFPEDGGDWGESKKKPGDSEMGVGDMIVMERARKRRKELEEEQRREDEQMQGREVEKEKEKQMEAIKEKRPVKPRPRKVEKEKESSVEVEVVHQVGPPSRPKPRPIPRSTTDMNIPDVLKGHAPFNAMRKQRASRSRSRGSTTDIEMGSDSGIETTVEISESDRESEVGYRAGSVERRRSPSASETGRRPSGKPSSSRSRSLRNIGQVDISSSQTDASSTAVVNGGLRITRSRSRSVARSPARSGYGSERMAVDHGSDSDEVEVVEQLTKTPVQKRTLHRREDNDDTPKASKPVSMSFQPLRAAQERRAKKATSHDPENRKSNGGPSTSSRKPTKTESSWLLDDSSQEV